MTRIRRSAGAAVLLVLLVFGAVWMLHPWMTVGVSPFRSVNEAEGLALHVEAGSVSSTGAILHFVNATDREWQFGQEYWIEKKEDGEWHAIRSLRSQVFDTLSYLLAPHSTREEVCSFADGYGRLTSGEYRLVKELLREKSGGWESKYVAAEFALE